MKSGANRAISRPAIVAAARQQTTINVSFRWFAGHSEVPVLPDEGSVSRQIGQLKAGNQAAALPLWTRYFQHLVRLARKGMRGRTSGAADEEDIALSVFARFCQKAERGDLPHVRNRQDLWRLLVTLTVRAAIDQVRYDARQKRSGPADSLVQSPAPVPAWDGNFEELADHRPAPEFIAQVAEECERLLLGLDDETLQSIAVWKTEGYTNEEIAARLGVVLRTVERKVHAIRERWAGEAIGGPSEATETL